MSSLDDLRIERPFGAGDTDNHHLQVPRTGVFEVVDLIQKDRDGITLLHRSILRSHMRRASTFQHVIELFHTFVTLFRRQIAVARR